MLFFGNFQEKIKAVSSPRFILYALESSKIPNDFEILGSLTLPTQTVFFYGALIQTFGLLASNVAGYTKKTTANAMVFMVSSVGGIGGPFAFKGSEATEGYPTGMIILMVSMAAAEVALAVLLYGPRAPFYFEPAANSLLTKSPPRIYYKRLNRRRDLAMSAEGTTHALRSSMTEDQAAFLDLTDHENPYFRYSY